MNGFSAADMSTAAANGFRDGLAAQPGAAQEAVAWQRRYAKPAPDGSRYEWHEISREQYLESPEGKWASAYELRELFDRPAPVAAAQEAVAWFTDDHLTDRSATTYDAAVAERWRAKGWPVTPLYAAPVAAAPVFITDGDPTWRHGTKAYTVTVENGSVQIMVVDGARVEFIGEAKSYRANTPAAPGIDHAQFKDLIGFAAWSAINLPETDPRRDFIRQASELLALIDASPKGQ